MTPTWFPKQKGNRHAHRPRNPENRHPPDRAVAIVAGVFPGLKRDYAGPMVAERQVYNFQVNHDGKAYDCRRIVSGSRRLTQTMEVLGVGSKRDTAIYATSNGRPIESMESIARVLAGEILRGDP